jgi:hypothetical protein
MRYVEGVKHFLSDIRCRSIAAVVLSNMETRAKYSIVLVAGQINNYRLLRRAYFDPAMTLSGITAEQYITFGKPNPLEALTASSLLNHKLETPH